MRVLVVSGIWPPDPGGPASHAPALAAFLQGRGHEVEAVTTASAPPEPAGYPVRWVSRGLPPGVRHLRCVTAVRSGARRADVVYATSMVRRAALGAGLARRPLVVKLVSDEVFERARRSGRFDGTLDAFQQVGGPRNGILRWARDAALRRARRVLCPSAYLRDVALTWGLDPERITVVANPAPAVPKLPSRDELRHELDLEGDDLVFAFAGRLGPQKALGSALEALAVVPGPLLLVGGDGPERAELERRARELRLGERVRFLGPLSRDGVLRLFSAADASLLPSSWENFPHTIVESLAVGTPVVATAVGGVPEVVRNGENGLLVVPGDPEALAGAIRQLADDVPLRERLAAAAAPSVGALTEEAVFVRIEAELLGAAR